MTVVRCLERCWTRSKERCQVSLTSTLIYHLVVNYLNRRHSPRRRNSNKIKIHTLKTHLFHVTVNMPWVIYFFLLLGTVPEELRGDRFRNREKFG